MGKHGVTRRRALKLTSGLVLAAGCSRKASDACFGNSDDTLDDALAALHEYAPEYGGLSNHGPMAAEALVELGRTDRVCEWVGGYQSRLIPLLPADSLSAQEQSDYLGDALHMEAWIATYLEIMDGSDPESVLANAWPTLLEGFEAASFHSALRTAHALRSLERSDTPIRRDELAHALGFWSARYTQLPGSPGATPTAGLNVVDALEQIPLLPEDQRQNGGTIYTRLSQLVGFQPFADAVELVDLDALPVPEAISALAGAGARLYIADAGRNDLGLLHAVTGCSALRLMLGWMDSASQRTALGAVFRTVAALHATHSEEAGVPNDTYDPSSSPTALREDAGRAADEHQIKLAEALLREYAVEERPELLQAAELVL